MPINNIVKKDFINNLSNKTGYSINFSKKIINDLIYIINLNIKNGNLNLKNIGSFKLLFKKERIGRNPKTKQEFKINARYSVSFSPSKKLIESLNND